MENAHDVTFKENVVFEFESPRKGWFGDCVAVDEYSTNVKGVEGVKCVNGPGRA